MVLESSTSESPADDSEEVNPTIKISSFCHFDEGEIFTTNIKVV
jgi:hypothetical protein